MITVQPEAYKDCIPEMMAMYPAHYEELSRTKQKPLNPQYAIYDMLAEKGNINVIAARDNGILIGYLMYMLAPDLHYGGISAIEDIYYLKPEYRGQMIGSRLFKEFEKDAKNKGAWKIQISTKVHKDNSAIFERCGMSEHEKIFIKVL